MQIMIVVLILAAVGIGASLFTGKDDTKLEELTEEMIEDQIGIDIDLSPKTKESIE